MTIIALAVGTACVLSSGTFIVTYEFQGFTPVIGNMQYVAVDLTTEDKYAKHKDKLESIDAVSIVGDIVNLEGTAASSEIWISDSLYNTPALVRTNATQIFVTPSIIPGDTLHINYASGLSYIKNVNVFESEIEKGGKFYAYAIPSGTAVMAYDIAVIITLTAGM